jgi:cell division protein FtsW
MKSRSKQRKSVKFHYDILIVLFSISLLIFGLLMVGSASMVISDKLYHFPFYFVLKQLLYILVGCFCAWGVTRLPMKVWHDFSIKLMFVAIFCLVLVLIPGIGSVVNGSRRWIRLGFMSLQVSEFAKLASIIYLSSYLARYKNQVQDSLSGFLKPMIVLAVLGVLLLLEPDFGALFVITTVFLSLLFIAGARWWPFLLMFVVVAVAMMLLAVLSPYRMLRLTTFLHPWHQAYGSGYQLTQSLIAFGRGGVFGVGLGNSIQKLFYLPEAHTDFVFAVLAEELGLIGELLLVSLFFLLVSRIISLATLCYQRRQLFSAYLSYGIAFWIAWQALINMGVNAGILPTKGLTLPLISYGGSSLLVTCVALGIVLRIAYEVNLESGLLPKALPKQKTRKRSRR